MSYFYDEKKDMPKFGRVVLVCCVIIACISAAGMAGCPEYNVWQQRLQGEASLARATQDRQIAVQEANAKE